MWASGLSHEREAHDAANPTTPSPRSALTDWKPNAIIQSEPITRHCIRAAMTLSDIFARLGGRALQTSWFLRAPIILKSVHQ
ncbi:hypothetical protein [Nocardia sp. NBC_00403]|uniref:hypothetical protein n=1 Tax=Nocardia sp. NBC_00403 TaxID=2975990 RepID=UPI002E2434F1